MGWNVFRKMFHHLQSCEYNSKKIPYIHLLNKKLNLLSDWRYCYYKKIYSHTFENSCNNSVSPLLSYYIGGNYSNKCTLYYHNFNNSDKLLLDKIGNNIIHILKN